MNMSILRGARSALAAGGLALVLATGCSALRSESTPGTPSFYALDSRHGGAPMASTVAIVESGAATMGPTLVVGVPHAVAGFDSRRLIYVRQQHKLEYFSASEWIDTPARMLSPLVVAELERRGDFRAVVQAPAAASGELRLDTGIMLLQQEFGGAPSQVRFVLRATLIEDDSRLVIATREFQAVVKASGEDPYSGVVAANQAVRQVVDELASFCSAAAARWQREQSPAGR